MKSLVTCLIAIALTGCTISLTSGGFSSSPAPAVIVAANNLVWSASSPTYSLTIAPSWILASGVSIASQSIQYYSDGVCGVPSGSPVTLSDSATTHSFAGTNLGTYSYKITTTSTTGSPLVSTCSAAISIDTSACTGSRLTNAPYADGIGTVADPFLICTAAQMNAIGTTASDWTKNFKLISDIDLSVYTGTQFNIIGTVASPFTGVFDGNNHTISNLTITNPAVDSTALFGSLSGASAIIKDLTLANVSITQNSQLAAVASLVADMRLGATVTNCKVVSGTIRQIAYAFGQIAGGLVGRMNSSTITNSSSAVTFALDHISTSGGGVVANATSSTLSNLAFTGVFSGSYVGNIPTGAAINNAGGIVGIMDDTTLTESYSSGAVFSSSANNVGGLVGNMYGSSSIVRSFVTGSVSGFSFALGGLVGQISSDATYGIFNSYSLALTDNIKPTNSITGGIVGKVAVGGTPSITNCYAAGSVLVKGPQVGGLVGSDSVGDTINGANRAVYSGNFWNSQVNATITEGVFQGANPGGVIAKTTTELQTATTFTALGWASPPWNFSTTGSYFKLSWEP